MRVIAVIPARYGSTRFPGKPLAILAGKPMVAHVLERVGKVQSISRVLVATDDERIAQAAREWGGEAVMTGDCRSGTDRVFEASRFLDADIIINVQGDEPLIESDCLENLIALFSDSNVQMGTLKRVLEHEERNNPNVVKVVTNLIGDALYFSRLPIPYTRTPEAAAQTFAHVGVYGYRKPFLENLASLPSTPLERAEGLEQLRVLEHGYKIRVGMTNYRGLGVDCPLDLERAEKLLKISK